MAAYLAKYPTKATEVAGHVSSRLNAATIGAYATGRTHPNMASRVACGVRPVRLWAHMLGFGGHFSTRSRAYSTTLRILRHARREWRRRPWHRSTNEPAKEAIKIVTSLSATPASAGTPTAMPTSPTPPPPDAPERRRTARDETQHIADLMAH